MSSPSTVTAIQTNPPSGKLILFDVLTILGFTSLSLVVLVAHFSSRIQRNALWFRHMNSWIIYSASYLLLIGHQMGPEPPFGLCVLQSALIYAAPTLPSLTAVAFVIDLYITLSSIVQRKAKIRPAMAKLLIVFPPFVYATVFMVSLLVQYSIVPDTTYVARGADHLYCHISLSTPTWIAAFIVIGGGLIIIPLEIWIAVVVYRNWAAFQYMSKGEKEQQSHVSLGTFMRVAAFTILYLTGICVGFITLKEKETTSVSNWQLVLPTVSSFRPPKTPYPLRGTFPPSFFTPPPRFSLRSTLSLSLTPLTTRMATLPVPPAPSRTPSGGYALPEGTYYISKPFRSRSSKKLRAMVAFAPRESHFDINNPTSGANEFRGFFTLFWISMFIFTVSTYIRSIETNGHALNLRFATMFSRDAITLALSDALLVGSTALCVPFAKAISKGWIRYYWTGLIVQHLLQTTALVAAVSWTFNRDWPWVQSGFFTLHTLVMIMKVHSYMTVNGHLQYVSETANSLLHRMKKATEAAGGWDQAIKDAEARRTELESTNNSTLDHTPSETPSLPPGTTTSYVDATTAAALQQRLFAVSNASKKDDDFAKHSSEPHILVNHPNEGIAAMARDYSELANELTSTGPYSVSYPDNITFKNFAVYQLIPTLVYELEYPRTNRIRPLYVFEKTVATFGTFALLYTVTETFILPRANVGNSSFARAMLDLSLPFMIAYLLLFYIIFECICNGFAELSYFADRQFYEDWWNSTSWDEFSRKWNKPVHTFLLNHVYASTMASYRLSRGAAMFITFLLSACVHELVMVIVTRKFRQVNGAPMFHD
ncbi:O-acyltransferase [Mycena indigotica]|uniref:O-acyltransferase n=1 Tax=Mycena indigotica TaxID=2126181 RepID=A0A8H6T3V0_9AGAR|nr:O-acyltransferase [Mycena indigotica]KAF7309847.1 O-acyltransferase [Mycena indigotica]